MRCTSVQGAQAVKKLLRGNRAEKDCSIVRAEHANKIYQQAIVEYHVEDSIDNAPSSPYTGIDGLLYTKAWIDTVQWHLEDIIRSPNLGGDLFITTKRRIDKSNQERTDCVEKLDDHFLAMFANVKRNPEARMNSETPAWLLDRMSILQLKIYHMRDQTTRKDVDAAHIANCKEKLTILLEQEADMSLCLDQLIDDIQQGRRFMKVYRQMKMYNDPKLNPILYGGAKST
ncbi:MAG: DUF4254 domain-containing protein [Spirochaetia bacterium]|nr:DUF4254 domain-containing protein [Spirochaetia bacterium]